MPEDDSDVSLILWSVKYISGLHCEQYCVQLQLHKIKQINKKERERKKELAVRSVFKQELDF